MQSKCSLEGKNRSILHELLKRGTNVSLAPPQLLSIFSHSSGSSHLFIYHRESFEHRTSVCTFSGFLQFCFQVDLVFSVSELGQPKPPVFQVLPI